MLDVIISQHTLILLLSQYGIEWPNTHTHLYEETHTKQINYKTKKKQNGVGREKKKEKGK